ncbi:MAG: hypothetical protein HYS78_00910 [Parcubacteria group bacterium]|nr:hypothetical protein [Parcubacteria group bacterium]
MDEVHNRFWEGAEVAVRRDCAIFQNRKTNGFSAVRRQEEYLAHAVFPEAVFDIAVGHADKNGGLGPYQKLHHKDLLSTAIILSRVIKSSYSSLQIFKQKISPSAGSRKSYLI